MNKILKYELGRLLRSRLFLGFLVVNMWYGWQILNHTVIFGVANTAPFSPWSFGSYLSRLLPLLSVALLFFLWNQHNEKARNMALLTDATPISPGRYLIIKTSALSLAWLLMALAAVGLGLGFLLALFEGDVPFPALLLTSAVTLAPPLVLFLGVGSLVGRIHAGLLFPLMALALGIGFLPLPATWDLYGTWFFLEYPLTLETLDPAFSMPMPVVLGKLLFLLLGIACFAQSIATGKRPSKIANPALGPTGGEMPAP